MGTISVSLPSDGETIDAADYNTPINTIVTEVNGNLDNANISTTAAIAGSKIADGAITHSKLAAGMVVQMVSTNFSSVATGTGIIPYDDTVPQNTEGDEYMTQVITPKASTNLLVIEVVAYLSGSAASKFLNVALFQDSTTGALAAVAHYNLTATEAEPIKLTYTMTAGTTSSTTFKIRAGADSTTSTTTFNGSSGGRKFGAIPKSNITITEIKV